MITQVICLCTSSMIPAIIVPATKIASYLAQVHPNESQFRCFGSTWLYVMIQWCGDGNNIKADRIPACSSTDEQHNWRSLIDYEKRRWFSCLLRHLDALCMVSLTYLIFSSFISKLLDIPTLTLADVMINIILAIFFHSLTIPCMFVFSTNPLYCALDWNVALVDGKFQAKYIVGQCQQCNASVH